MKVHIQKLSYRLDGGKGTKMKLLKIDGYGNTIRSVMDNEKTTVYGMISTVGDLLDAEIFTYCDCPRKTWVYIPNHTSPEIQFANTRRKIKAIAKRHIELTEREDGQYAETGQ